MTILGGPESLRPSAANLESKHAPPAQPAEEKPDAAARARANDLTEALLEQRAWEDGERKADAEAEALEHLQNL